MRDPNPEPYLHGIQGECGSCGFIYGLQWGFDCPRCHNVALKRVSMNTHDVYDQSRASYGEEMSPYPHVLNNEGTACRWDCDACEWVRKEKPAVDELNKIYALEDKR
jgi:hypothetical protein